MAGLYYFLPNVTRDGLLENPRLVAAVPVLSDLSKPDEHFTASDCRRGPGGVWGVVVYPLPVSRQMPPSLQYRPEQQGWLESRNGKYWIGWLKDALPTPADLERAPNYPGYLVTDSHGQQWSIPIARSPDPETSSLPKSFTFDEAGEPVAKLKDEFQQLWEISGKVWDFYETPPADRSEELTDTWAIKQAAFALGVNYRLGLDQLNALHECDRGILDTGTVDNILLALIDRDRYIDWLQKKRTRNHASEPETLNSGIGETNGSKDSRPVAQSC